MSELARDRFGRLLPLKTASLEHAEIQSSEERGMAPGPEHGMQHLVLHDALIQAIATSDEDVACTDPLPGAERVGIVLLSRAGEAPGWGVVPHQGLERRLRDAATGQYELVPPGVGQGGRDVLGRVLKQPNHVGAGRAGPLPCPRTDAADQDERGNEQSYGSPNRAGLHR